MSRTATIEGLKREREELEEMRNEIDAKLDAITLIIAHIESGPVKSVRTSEKSQRIRDAIYKILEEDGPLHRKDVYKRLCAVGIKVGGDTEARRVNNVGAHLSHDNRFLGAGEKGVWDLRERVNGQSELPASMLP
ncbi:MAG: hypothetical protein OXG11_04225 [Chloroflexi bacterium]|nr:hypothetical protein [Chloroflexota bacterium]